MKKSSWLSLVMAVALVLLCGKMALSGGKGEVNPNDMQDSIINNIMTRVSVRKYTDKTVEDEKVEKILQAAMAAPSAVNKQPWHFIVVDDKATLENIAKQMPNAAMAENAPLAIVVCGDLEKEDDGPNKEFWIQDCSAAIENMLLAAHALGLGAVWTGIYPRAERCKVVSDMMKLPETMVPLATVVIGYPDENPQPKDKWDLDNISYNFFEGTKGETVEQQEDAKEQEQKKAFTDFDVEKEFRENGFQFFHGKGTHGILLAVGDKNKSNAMTIGWGAIGTLWGHNDAVTVYVAEKRFTKEFMDKAKYFTVMTFSPKHADVLDYMGSHSGRDGDKAKALGLHTMYTENGTPYYEEADMVIECEMMYAAPFDKSGFKKVPAELYSDFPAGIHSQYIGRVVKAMKK